MIQPKNLILIQAIIWIMVSAMLIVRTTIWAGEMSQNQLVVASLVGIILGITKYLLIFRKTAKKAIARIYGFTAKKVSLLKLYSPKTYMLVVLMIVLGIIIRHLEFIPKTIIFPIYAAVGLAMFLTSINLFVAWLKNLRFNK